MAQNGLKFTFLMRLCPIIPYNAYNYILGVTSVSLKDFAIGGFGMIPGAFIYVFIGTTLGSVNEAISGNFENGTLFLIFLIIGSISALLAMILLTVKVKRYLYASMGKNSKVRPLTQIELANKPLEEPRLSTVVPLAADEQNPHRIV